MSGKMARWAAVIVLAASWWAWWSSSGEAQAQAPVTVTVRQLFEQGHRLEVVAGTEVAWADPHFDRVWLSPGEGAPQLVRGAAGFRAVFASPGLYRGAFTVAGGHGTTDVYGMTVVVRPLAPTR